MNNLQKGLVLVAVILAISVGLVVWKKKVGHGGSESFNEITRPQLEMLLADAGKQNPMILKRLKEDPEMKKQQIENLKQLLAFASQATRDGLASEPENKQELENVKAEVLAVNYDKEINKDKGPLPPFGFITDEMIQGYWDEDTHPKAGKGFFGNLWATLTAEEIDGRSHEEEFNQFLDSKIAVMKKGNPELADKEITEEEKTEARKIFAKLRIYKHEYEEKAKSGELPKEFVDKMKLQVKLQQASFLARIYSEKVTEKTKVSDDEIDKYIASHPELDPKEKRAKAQDILNRAKAGEDFAALANQYTEDPGNKGPDGNPLGGIYKDVPKGRMVAPFETAALGLQAGQVAPELVETDFGFHIIKLERALGPTADKEAKPAASGAPAGDTYDVRHILISTGYKDPNNPMARDMPVKDFVRNKLETEKEKQVIEEIVAANHIVVPDDYTVPEVTDEQLQQMRRQQMPQMPPPGAGPDADDDKPAKPEAKKPEPKKK